MWIQHIDHIQLAMPAGKENEAQQFYQDLLGIPRVPKPPHLALRGGAWFERGALKVHLGVDKHFVAATKAHPAFIVCNLEQLVAKLKQAAVPVVDDQPLEGYHRVYVSDPFGNRLELMEPHG